MFAERVQPSEKENELRVMANDRIEYLFQKDNEMKI